LFVGTVFGCLWRDFGAVAWSRLAAGLMVATAIGGRRFAGRCGGRNAFASRDSCVLLRLATATRDGGCIISIRRLLGRGITASHPLRCGSGCTGMLVVGPEGTLVKGGYRRANRTCLAGDFGAARVGAVGSRSNLGTSGRVGSTLGTSVKGRATVGSGSNPGGTVAVGTSAGVFSAELLRLSRISVRVFNTATSVSANGASGEPGEGFCRACKISFVPAITRSTEEAVGMVTL
jgi:hypothetical protein